MNPENEHRSKIIYNKYTFSEKLFYFSLWDNGLSKHEIENKYNVPTSTLRSCVDIEEELKNVIGKEIKYRLPGGENRPETELIEPELTHWILYLRDLGIAFTTHEIIFKAIELMPSLKSKSYKTLCKWCERFLKRKGFSYRIPTHIGQKAKNDAIEQLMIFLGLILLLEKNIK